MKDFRVVLKVCEACGALWLRAADQGVYCRGCALRLSEFPTPWAESRRVRLSKVERNSQQREKNAGPGIRVVGCMGGAR
jgi:hypothetical protein